MCEQKPELIAMNGHCGGIAPGPLPLLMGPPVDVCPVVLAQPAAAVEALAVDLFRGLPAPHTPTPFVQGLMRLVDEWKAARAAAAGGAHGQ